jgi:nitroreductase
MPKLLAILIIALFLPVTAALGDSKLPAPQTDGGMGIFTALKNRSSAPGGDFPIGAVSAQELSNLLWAASGLNRGEKGWTVPMSRGLPPYCRIYVADSAGVSLYDWKNHQLQSISAQNLKSRLGAQNFVKNAPVILIIVSNHKELIAAFKEEKLAAEFAHALTGAMTQDIYLASAAMNIGARYIHSMQVGEIKAALQLPEGDEPICLMMLGK